MIEAVKARLRTGSNEQGFDRRLIAAIGSSAATGAFFCHSADTRGLHELAAFMLVAAAVLVLVTVADRSLRLVGRPVPAEAGERSSSG